MTQLNRRQVIQGLGASALSPLLVNHGSAHAQAKEIVIGAAQPITGVFAFAGVQMNNGLNDFIEWKNSKGGVQGRKLRYVMEDSGFKVDQGVAIFKKIMAAEKPNFFYCDGTPLVKAITRDAVDSKHVMTSSTSLASAVADAANVPQHFVPGATYGRLHEVLMEHIAKTWKGAEKPRIAYVYTEAEFGIDGIPAAKARAAKLGLPIVAEVITKPGGVGVDISTEVAKLRRAKPNIVVFQGYINAPMPEFARQMKEAGMNVDIYGTAWGLDKPAFDGLAAVGANLTGASLYAVSDEDVPMLREIRLHLAKARPGVTHLSPFYLTSWFSGMVFAEIAERCLKANKALTLDNMRAALESIKNWDTGGLIGLPVDLSKHEVPAGRVIKYNPAKKAMEPAGDWIKV
ncbi:MAG: ABC transporter substrate-binding protein [Burkholderiaceae bacterium]